MATLTNIQTVVTSEQLEQLAITDLVYELGIALFLDPEITLPVWPFVALGFAIDEIINLFGGGKPVTVDTDNVISAYNMSAYWPLHALAADLQEMLKNGAPISDSRPAIQAQFGTLKQGTVESLQSFAHAQPGPNGAGYWQFFNLIQLSWQYAGNPTIVLDLVKAIDQMTIGISQLETQPAPAPAPTPKPPPIGIGPQQPPTPVPEPGPTTPTPTTQAPCPPYTELPDCLPAAPAADPTQDELSNLLTSVGYWLQILAIYAMNSYQRGAAATTPPATPPATPNGTTTDPVTCAQLTGLFNRLITAIGGINVSVPPGTPPDLTPLVTALEAIGTALNKLLTPTEGQPPDLSVLNAQAQSELDARNALAAALLDVDADIQAQAAQYGNQL